MSKTSQDNRYVETMRNFIVFSIAIFLLLPAFDHIASVNTAFALERNTNTPERLNLSDDYENVRSDSGNNRYRSMLEAFSEELEPPLGFSTKALGKEFKDPITGMKFVFIEGGCYLMGDIFDNGESDEKPVHEVCVDDFWIGQYEVTQSQWQTIMGINPSHFKNCGDTCPVEKVSWHDAQEFIKKFNKMSPKNYRLPTEAEWEYAARSGGRRETFAGTNNQSELENYAWCTDNADSKIHPVGQKKPNDLGLYDMSGNVWEWVQDCYGSDYYKNSSRKNPTGPGSGKYHVLRGGSWYGEPWFSRTVARFRYEPSSRFIFFGFRLALSFNY